MTFSNVSFTSKRCNIHMTFKPRFTSSTEMSHPYDVQATFYVCQRDVTSIWRSSHVLHQVPRCHIHMMFKQRFMSKRCHIHMMFKQRFMHVEEMSHPYDVQATFYARQRDVTSIWCSSNVLCQRDVTSIWRSSNVLCQRDVTSIWGSSNVLCTSKRCILSVSFLSDNNVQITLWRCQNDVLFHIEVQLSSSSR